MWVGLKTLTFPHQIYTVGWKTFWVDPAPSKVSQEIITKEESDSLSSHYDVGEGSRKKKKAGV